MSFILTPQHSFKSLTDVSPSFLKSIGIELLLLDLDNTISPYGIYTPTDAVSEWVRSCKEAGIVLFIVSNSKSSYRTVGFADALEIEYLNRAKKPSRRGIREAMSLCGKTKEHTALVGDQIYTDVLSANRSGVVSILIEPISLKNPLLAIRYAFEIPFRLMSKNKHGR